MASYKMVFYLLLCLIVGIFIGRVLIPNDISDICNRFILISKTDQSQPSIGTLLSSNVHVINVNEPVKAQFQCIKTKTLLNFLNTTICLHDAKDDTHISKAFVGQKSIWDELKVLRIIQVLLRHPHLDFIDVGANIGGYTMYAAALGRFVMAIECFAPNMQRLHRAVQLANVANRVLLIQNAIYSHSGQVLRLNKNANNIGAQGLELSTKKAINQNVTNDPYLVRTIQFDDLLPLLVSRGVRGAIMKTDIEGSENFLVESGRRMFETLEIPFVQMEWMFFRTALDRGEIISKFFIQRDYQPFTFECQLLNLTSISIWPNDVFWIKRNSSNFC